MSTELSRGLRDIRAATDDLIRAARNLDPDAIRDAVDRREDAVRRFDAAAGNVGDAIDPATAEMLTREKQALDEQARLAEDELRTVASKARAQLDRALTDADALRTYAADSTSDRHLDISG